MNPLIWSKSRRRTFEQCRREWFLHYVAARGAPGTVSAETELITRCRRLIRLEWYFHRVFRDALHNEHGGARPVIDALWQRWRRDRASGRETFQELFYGETGAAALAEAGIAELRRRAELFKNSVLADRLNSETLERHSLDLPIAFPLGEVQIYAAPFALFRDGGEWLFCELAGDRMAETAALHRYFGFRFLGLPAAAIRSWFYDPAAGTMYSPEPGELNFTTTADRIGCEAAEMASACPDPVAEAGAYLAAPGNRSHCPVCRFRAVCEGAI